VAVYNLGRNRLSFGFFSWRIGSRITETWHYMTFRKHMVHGFQQIPDGTVGGSNGPYPTSTSEDSREGIDDYRYLFLLESLLKQGEKSPDSAVQKATSEAREVVDITRARVSENLLAARNSDFTPEILQRMRWRVAIAAENLQKALNVTIRK
jgi:hypothetical protein